jgi:aminoglycoside phosphotransferase (APT) family kinase protein
MVGYNIPFWVHFDDTTKWVIRFPMIGAIAPELVDEKLRMEVATIMFLSEKTTIPIPQVIGYGLTNNPRRPKGLPFSILTHMHGKPLPVIWDCLDTEAKEKISDQLADIYIQLPPA